MKLIGLLGLKIAFLAFSIAGNPLELRVKLQERPEGLNSVAEAGTTVYRSAKLKEDLKENAKEGDPKENDITEGYHADKATKLSSASLRDGTPDKRTRGIRGYRGGYGRITKQGPDPGCDDLCKNKCKCWQSDRRAYVTGIGPEEKSAYLAKCNNLCKNPGTCTLKQCAIGIDCPRCTRCTKPGPFGPVVTKCPR